MADSITIHNVPFLSSKEASRRYGYSSDYVARLAREGKVNATRVGAQWFVDPKSLESFSQIVDEAKQKRRAQLQQERKIEIAQAATTAGQRSKAHNLAIEPTYRAHAVAFSLVATGFLFALSYSGALDRVAQVLPTTFSEARIIAYGLYRLPQDVVRGTVPELSRVEVGHTTEKGIVVLPNNASDAVVEEVKESFSDTVEVSIDETGNSGIITPIFNGEEGQSHRFVMVPLRSPP